MTDRPRVVMLPALGLDARMFDPMVRALKDRAEVLALDYPELEPTPAETLLARVADWLAPRALDGGRPIAILGGVSLGATLAIMLRERVRPQALLLMAGGGSKVPTARREAVLHAMSATDEASFAIESLGLDGPDFDHSRFREHFGGSTDDARAYYSHWRKHVWSVDETPRRAAAHCALLRAALAVDLEDELAANEVPADIVWGENDRVFSERTRQKYVATLRSGTLHLLPGVGHFAPLEAPAELAAIVLARLGLVEAS